MDYEFSKTQLDFLKRFGESSNGQELGSLLKSMSAEIDRSSNIPSDADYGAQVEGRKLVIQLFKKLLDAMKKPKAIPFESELGNDEFD